MQNLIQRIRQIKLKRHDTRNGIMPPAESIIKPPMLIFELYHVIFDSFQ